MSHRGVHLSNDSYTYLGAAHNLAEGKGWTYPFGTVGAPVTLFPPVYSLLLALPNALGIDVLHWTIWQNAILFAAFAAMAGMAVRWATAGSLWTIAVAMGLVVFGKPTTLVYRIAWSETVFLPLELLALFFLARSIATRRSIHLIAAAIATSLAMLTRYAGVSVLLTGVVILALWPGRRVLARAKDVAIYGAASLAASVVWSVRNLVKSGTLTGNNQVNHAFHWSQAKRGLDTLAAWFFPEPLPGRFGLELVVLVLLILIVLLVAWRLVRSARPTLRVSPIAITCLAFVVIHFLVLILANAYSTRLPPFNDRILGLAYAPLVIGFLLLLHDVVRGAGWLPIRATVIAAMAALLAAVALGTGPTLPDRFGTESGSADSVYLLARELRPYASPGRVILSNQSNVAWYVLDRAVIRLPSSCIGRKLLPNPLFYEELVSLGEGIARGPKLVLFFIYSRKCSPLSVPTLEDGLGVALKARVPTLKPRVTVLESG